MTAVLLMARPEFASVPLALAEEGYEVVEAYDSGHVLQIVMRREVDALVIPDDAAAIEGEDLLPLVRRLSRAAIVVVGQNDETRMTRALLMGADLYLRYPVTGPEVRTLLRALLRRRDRDRSTGQRRREQREDRGPLPFQFSFKPLTA